MKKLLLLMFLFVFKFISLPLIGQTTYTIGSGTDNTEHFPIFSAWNFSYSQQILLASDLQAAGAVAGEISKIRFYLNSTPTNPNNARAWVIYMGNTSKTEFSSNTDWIPITAMTNVFSDNVTFPSGGNWQEITLSTTITWDGTSNIVIAVDENSSGFPGNTNYNGTTTTTNQIIYYRHDSNNPNPASPPTASGISTRYANTQLVITPNVPSNVMFYNTGSASQLTFNNSFINETSPVFRVSATFASGYDRIKLQVSSDPDFTGTLHEQIFSGSYTSNTAYDITCNALDNSWGPVNGTTYYVRANASHDGGSTWGLWSSGTYSFTYKTTGEAEWYQQEQEQLESNIITDINTYDFGNNITRTNSATGFNSLYYITTTVTEDSYLTAFNVRIEGGAAAGRYVRMALYNSNYELITETNEVLFTNTLNTINVPTKPLLTTGTYYIAFRTNSSSTQVSTGSSGGSTSIYYTYAYGNFPQTLSTGTSWTGRPIWYITTETEKTITSVPVEFSSFLNAQSWNEVSWTTSGSGTVQVGVYADASATTELIAPTTSSPIDISGINTTTYGTLYLKATLEGASPQLDSWKVSAKYPAPNLIVDAVTTISAPAVYNNITIQPDGKLTLEDGASLTVEGNFIIESNASGTGTFLQEGNSTLNVTGTTTVQKYLPYEAGGGQSLGWYVSPAVGSAPYSTFSASQGLFEFSPTAADWVSLDKNAGTALTAGKGYVSRFPTNQTVTFTGGSLNSGAIPNNSLIRQASPNNFGWNLVGNPYPSFIDWDNGINKTNLNNSVHVRKGDGGIATYINGSGLNGGTRYIAPMQAFWVQVQASETTGSIEFTNASRLHNDTIPFFKLHNTPNLLLSINRAAYTDEMLIRFIDGATTNFDAAYDAAKLFSNNDNHPQIYTILDAGKEIAINSMPELIANITVAVGFTTNHADALEINAANLSTFDSNVEVILEDLYDNTMTNLKQTSNYSFNSATGAFNDRFLVHFNLTVANTEDINQQNIIVYTYDNAIYISNVVSNGASATLYNMLGQKVLSQELTAHTLNKINTATASGHYVLRIIDGSDTSSHKVHLK